MVLYAFQNAQPGDLFVQKAPAATIETLALAMKRVLAADNPLKICLLYTSDAADERSSVDLGGRRIIKKKNKQQIEM